jgi:hypothetical protein
MRVKCDDFNFLVPVHIGPMKHRSDEFDFASKSDTGEVNGAELSRYICRYRTDNGRRLPPSAAAAACSADDYEFLGAVGRLHYDLRLELRWLCHAQQQTDFSQCVMLHWR